MDFSHFSLVELAAYISDYLQKNGFDCILSGGACVSIYTENKYKSYDLDFIPYFSFDKKKLTEILAKIKFYPYNRYYKNDTTQYFIEFPPPPPAISNYYVSKSNIIMIKKYNLKLLTASDCVKDRLCSFFYFNDEQCLEQALLVAKDQKIDIEDVEKWAINEGEKEIFELFKKRLKQ